MPYWRLSSFYFFYFSALGVLVPFWALYLQSLGFTSVQIGELMAIPMATKFVAPYLWGWIGDHTGKRLTIVRSGSLAAFLTFLLVFWLTSFSGLAVAMALFSFFWNAVLPQIEVITFRYLGKESPKYSRVRVWGSIGFIATVVLLGFVVEQQGPGSILPVLAFLYFGIWVAALLVPDQGAESHEPSDHFMLALLKQPAVIAFLVSGFLMQMSHGAYYTFYSIYLEGVGYSKGIIGQLWGLGVLAEVVLYILFMHRLLVRFGAAKLLFASLVLAAIRWVLVGTFSESIFILVFAQLFHAATFGSFHAAAVFYVNHAFPLKLHGRAQAVYSSVSFGAGGASGALASGFLWDIAGPTANFLFMALLAGIAAVIAMLWLRDADSLN